LEVKLKISLNFGVVNCNFFLNKCFLKKMNFTQLFYGWEFTY
jgi:hypothetical protein